MIELIQFAQDNVRDLLILGMFIALGVIVTSLVFGAEQLRTRVEALETRLVPPGESSPTYPDVSTASSLSGPTVD